MSRIGPVVEEYGWKDPDETCAHEYIKPALLGILRRIKLKKVLDLGCGNGALTRSLLKAGFDAVGCDADKEGIEIAQANGGVFKVVSVYDNPSEIGEDLFDGVVSAEVIEHLFLPGYLPKFAHAVLKKNGYLIVTTPYHGYWKNLALSILNKWDSHIDPLWDGGHIKLWSRSTLSRLLTENGFSITEFHGVGRIPYLWKSMIIVARKV
jgi:2-polyprenyl-3-methyl-5-hydroxy-6-metoxy-1,4-benzoquinol methylase